MAKLDEHIKALTPLQRAVFALKEKSAQLESLERAQVEPIAIVGVGCRFPGGASNPQAYWRMLSAGVDAITDVPQERWDTDAYYDPDPLASAQSNSRCGGFIEHVDQFDNEFFGISEREARGIDPQQRLLLELAWEALEDAGMPASTLRGSNTGVFVGISGSDYWQLVSRDLSMSDAYVGTGTALSIAANRLSFAFDLRGPSIAIDSACSSSLVAAHLACQSLRSGESAVALVGGVNVVLSSAYAIILSKAGLTSPDGRVRPFDADASGYVRSEGGGMVVLKTLARAQRDGDPVYAVIRGSAVNENGFSNGLTAPNRQCQEAVLRAAYAKARVRPADVQYIECHGTGTLLGDTIEALALGNVVGAGRAAAQPCLLGAVKSNLGHMEAAAGVASLIKAALALRHGHIPPTLHYRKANPNIPFNEIHLRVPTELTPWPQAAGPRLAGVSAFGFGGTNAHLVLEQAPVAASQAGNRKAQPHAGRRHFLPLSARDPEALKMLAAAYRDLLRTTSASWADVCRAASLGRDHHHHRLAVVAGTAEQAADLLEASLADKQADDGVWQGQKPYGGQAKTVFVFADDPGVWRRLARPLCDNNVFFRQTLERWDERFRARTKFSPMAALRANSGFDDPAAAQALLFVLQASLAGALRELGVAPAVALGFGRGEPAAAYHAGVLSGEDALSVVLRRMALASGQDGGGSGVDIRSGVANAALICATGGEVRNSHQLGAEYWQRAAGEPSSVQAAVESLRDTLPDCFLEIGLASLTPGIERCFAAINPQGRAVAAAGAAQPDLVAELAVLYTVGHTLRWDKLNDGPRTPLALPHYPWQRRRLWVETALKSEGAAERKTRRSEEKTPQTNGLVYELRWRSAPPDDRAQGDVARHRNPPEGVPSRWLILADESGVGEALAARLKAMDCTVEVLHCDGQLWPDAVQSALQRKGDSGWQIVHLWGLNLDNAKPFFRSGFDANHQAALAVVTQLARHLAQPDDGGRLWLITRGAQMAADFDLTPHLAQASLWGLGRTLAREMPTRRGGLIDLDPRIEAGGEAAELVFDALIRPDGEDQIAIREGGRYIPRLVAREISTAAPLHLDVDKSYLITGRFDHRARDLARWLVAHGARRLVLAGMGKLPARRRWSDLDADTEAGRQTRAIRELEARGISVHLAAIDIGDEAALSKYLSGYAAGGWPPIRGVFHVPGGAPAASLVAQDIRVLEQTLRERLGVAWLLHEALAEVPLDFFVTVGAAEAILGVPGRAAEAAADAGLEQLARWRRAGGLPVLACATWDWDAPQEPLLSSAEGLAALGQLVAGGDVEAGLVLPSGDADWVRTRSGDAVSPMLAEITASRQTALRPRPQLSQPYEPARTELERKLAELWRETLKLDRVGLHDNFFELGGESLHGVIVINRLQEELQQTVHALAIFETQNIHDLAAYLRQNYPVAVKRICPDEVVGGADYVDPDWPETIDDGEVAKGRSLFAAYLPPASASGSGGAKNPRAIFILSPPRSGSTLLRVMLAGHKGLFVPPELELLPFDNVAERQASYAGTLGVLEGATRALMEIFGCNGEEAEGLMRGYEAQALPTTAFYRLIQERIGERILVDKTPSYSSQIETLQRAEMLFDQPLYIHLMRHPCGMIRSFLDYKMDQTYIVRFGVKQKLAYSPRQIGELVWTISHRNILDFLSTLPPERHCSIRFEDMVREPGKRMRSLSDFLGLDYQDAMAHPYRDHHQRMTDSTAAQGRMQGDQNFLVKHKTIDPGVADRWTQTMTSDFLGPPARRLAAELGYTEFAADAAPDRSIGRETAPSLAATSAEIPLARTGGDPEALLARLSELSDQDVDSLLEEMLSDADT